jgi:hypothetical protein
VLEVFRAVNLKLFLFLDLQISLFGCQCADNSTGRVQVRRAARLADRREWDRLPISIPFFVRGKKDSGEEFLEFATALNLSAGGVLLAARRFLEPGTQITLEVPVALVNKAQLPRSTSHLHAIVLRCTPDRQYFLLGLQFEEPLIAPQVAAREASPGKD